MLSFEKLQIDKNIVCCNLQAMNTLRSKPMIIFYLKLRHNNLAKLPAYIFLSLDIRHLTVHNSSLAVIEDSSLSSIGKKEYN